MKLVTPFYFECVNLRWNRKRLPFAVWKALTLELRFSIFNLRQYQHAA
jgi:hypothetical protein